MIEYKGNNGKNLIPVYMEEPKNNLKNNLNNQLIKAKKRNFKCPKCNNNNIISKCICGWKDEEYT